MFNEKSHSSWKTFLFTRSHSTTLTLSEIVRYMNEWGWMNCLNNFECASQNKQLIVVKLCLSQNLNNFLSIRNSFVFFIKTNKILPDDTTRWSSPFRASSGVRRRNESWRHQTSTFISCLLMRKIFSPAGFSCSTAAPHDIRATQNCVVVNDYEFVYMVADD